MSSDSGGLPDRLFRLEARRDMRPELPRQIFTVCASNRRDDRGSVGGETRLAISRPRRKQTVPTMPYKRTLESTNTYHDVDERRKAGASFSLANLNSKIRYTTPSPTRRHQPIPIVALCDRLANFKHRRFVDRLIVLPTILSACVHYLPQATRSSVGFCQTIRT